MTGIQWVGWRCWCHAVWNCVTQRRITLCLFIYLFIYFWPQQISVPWPGIEPRLQQWKPRILTTRPPGNSLSFILFDCWMFVRCLQRWVACVDYISLLTCKHGSTAQLFFGCSVQFVGTSFLHCQKSNPCPLQWKEAWSPDLTSGGKRPPGSSLHSFRLPWTFQDCNYVWERLFWMLF